MSMYQDIALRLQREYEYKKKQIYKYAKYALVTRFFPTGEIYPVNRTLCIAEALCPTMFAPFQII